MKRHKEFKRFMGFVDMKSAKGNCWVWTGGLQRGYGYFYTDTKKRVRAHRWLYEYSAGKIPSDCEIDHICRNKACVNPNHLRAVPHKVNVLCGEAPTAINAKKTHCYKGHEFSPENTIMTGKDKTWRTCRICKNAYARKLKAQKSKRASLDTKARGDGNG